MVILFKVKTMNGGYPFSAFNFVAAVIVFNGDTMDDLTSHFVEERSKVRYVVSIAESLELDGRWTLVRFLP